MRIKLLAGSLAGMLAITGLSASRASADTLAPGYNLTITTPVAGADANSPPNFTFTAEVQSAQYNVMSDPYAGGTWNGTIQSNDEIYAYIVSNVVPGNDPLEGFSVFSGNTIDAVGYANIPGSSTAQTTVFSSGTGGQTAQFLFNPVGVGQNTEVLLFAASGLLTTQSATVHDNGASGTGLVLSDAGANFPGVPLPVPASVWGGLTLFGLLAGFCARRHHAKIA